LAKESIENGMKGIFECMNITHDAVEHYIYKMLPERDEVLHEMEDEAGRRKIPIVGPAVGRLLYQLARMIEAKTVFEMGSAIGYSTIWWARAVGDGGEVIYTDGNRKNAEEAGGYIERSGSGRCVRMLVGDALELLSEEKREFDIIFNDVDKEDYPRVLRLVGPRLRKGGLFITDNTLWSGRVADAALHDRPGQEVEDTTKAIVEFNKLLYASKEFFTTIIPLRDGVSVAMKL
jgi:caffeoyl-CoA O-methyltransferase